MTDPPKKTFTLVGKGGQAFGGFRPPPRKQPDSAASTTTDSSPTPTGAAAAADGSTGSPSSREMSKDGKPADLRKAALSMHSKIKRIMETPKVNLQEEDIPLSQIIGVTFKQVRECDIEGIVITYVIELIKLNKAKSSTNNDDHSTSSSKNSSGNNNDTKDPYSDLMDTDPTPTSSKSKNFDKRVENDFYSKEDNSYFTQQDVELVQKVLLDVQTKLTSCALPLSIFDSSSSSSSSSQDHENSQPCTETPEKYILASDLESCVRNSYEHHNSSMDVSCNNSIEQGLSNSSLDLTTSKEEITTIHKKLKYKYEVVGSKDKGVRMNNEDFYIILEHLPQLFLQNQPLSCTTSTFSLDDSDQDNNHHHHHHHKQQEDTTTTTTTTTTTQDKETNHKGILAGDCPDLYIGLFDGHMGRQAAVYSITQLHINILRNPLFLKNHDLHSAIKSGFVRTDSSFNAWAKTQDNIKAGTTAISMFLSSNHLIIANCGDSKAILATRSSNETPPPPPPSSSSSPPPPPPTNEENSNEENSKDKEENSKEENSKEENSKEKEENWKGNNKLGKMKVGGEEEPLSKGIQVLSKTHHPDREDEKARLVKGGGKVVWFGTWRVNGLLAVSRSIGDRELSHLVIAEPELCEYEVNREWEFVVVASDGLWDVMTADVCVELVRKCVVKKGRKSVASYLISKAVGFKSKDNISVVVLFFDFDENES